MKALEEYVRSIPDFPEKGIIFRDVTSVLQDADGLRLAIDTMEGKIRDLEYDVVAGPESRGFIFGVPIAYALGKHDQTDREPGRRSGRRCGADGTGRIKGPGADCGLPTGGGHNVSRQLAGTYTYSCRALGACGFRGYRKA